MMQRIYRPAGQHRRMMQELLARQAALLMLDGDMEAAAELLLASRNPQ